MDPTVITTGSKGRFSRETIVCQARMVRAAITIGSTVSCGAAPWPPLPKMVTSTESELAAEKPGVYPTFPAGKLYRHVLTLIILRGHVAGVRQSGLLWNGQGIELSADHDSGAGAVLQDADDPCSA